MNKNCCWSNKHIVQVCLGSDKYGFETKIPQLSVMWYDWKWQWWLIAINECVIFSVCGTLTHWGRDKVDTISQTTSSNIIYWMKMYEFPPNFIDVCSQGSNLQYPSIGSEAVLATSHYRNQWWLVYRRVNASLGLNELNMIVSFVRRTCYFAIFWRN